MSYCFARHWIAFFALVAALRSLNAAELRLREVVETLFKASPASQPDFSHKDLSSLDLSGLDFKEARLAGANLLGDDLSDANLSGG